MMGNAKRIGLVLLVVGLIGMASTAQGAVLASGVDGVTGLYNAYQLNTTGMTWDAARVAAYNTSFVGVAGHLATVTSAVENATVDSIAGDAWIGLTDSDATSTIDSATMPGTEGTFYLVTGGVAPYLNWGGRQPNDSGGEDAVQIRGDGAWNDHRAGVSLGQTDHNLQSVIEFDLNSATDPADGGLPVFNYREKNGGGTIDSLADAEALLASSGGTEKNALATVVNLGSGGNYGSPDSFIIGGDDFASEFTTNVLIPSAGDWTFGTNTDDGSGLTVGPFMKDDDVLAGPHNHLATFNFATAGWHPLRLVFFERGGGDEVELFAAPGAQGSFNANFALVGDTANGGLRIVNGIVPEPATLLIWSLLAGLGVGLGWRRKR